MSVIRFLLSEIISILSLYLFLLLARCVLAGVIMMHLGVDLLLSAFVTSRKTLDSLEYSSMLLVCLVVSFQGFVSGSVLCMRSYY